MSGRAPAVTVERVSYAYVREATPAVHGIDLELPDAAITAILGANGSGKTTLLNLILGWLVPTEGRIRVHGREHRQRGRRERSRQVGLVSQDDAGVFELELAEYVLLGRAPYLGLLERPGPHDLAAVDTVLATTGLEALRTRQVSSLSTGERQLASIARALVQDPRVLLLDEPLSHLDLANTRGVLGLIAGLRRRGHAVVLTTHDPNVAAAVADRVVLLRRGRLVADGSPAEMLTHQLLAATYGVDVEVLSTGGRTVVLPALDFAPDRPTDRSSTEPDALER
jgi:iron complex transport system ATP-binding protein